MLASVTVEGPGRTLKRAVSLIDRADLSAKSA